MKIAPAVMLILSAIASVANAVEPVTDDKKEADGLICRWEEKIGTRIVTNNAARPRHNGPKPAV